MKKASFICLFFVLFVSLVVSQRFRVLLFFLGSGSPPALLEATDEGTQVRWYDDYFIVQVIDPTTFTIGEPRYHQQNFNYLIVGSERAILFDAGSGYRDIRPVADELTDRPITFVPSHFHFDHVGNDVTFDHVAVVDLPHLRDRATNNELQLRWYEHLGRIEGYDPPTLKVDEWLEPGELVDLGERKLRVLFTPGHTDDSISLLDEAAGYLFSGDFMYPGPLFAFLPNSGMGDYLQGTNTVLAAAVSDTRIFGAHRSGPPGAPEQALSDVRDLKKVIQSIRGGEVDGEGFYPVTYIVSPTLQLLTEPVWFQNWEARYPELGPG